jgi:hypothetical protein
MLRFFARWIVTTATPSPAILIEGFDASSSAGGTRSHAGDDLSDAAKTTLPGGCIASGRFDSFPPIHSDRFSMLWVPRISIAVGLCLLALLAQTGSAATADIALSPTTQSAPQPGDELSIYVLTFQPGDEIWEKFGHNTIWVHDESIPDPAYRDAVYNWGLFDFDAPHFYSNFLFGVMDYWMEPLSFGGTIDFYHSQNRSMWAQKLNLSAAQKLDLSDFLEWNARPENRFYHYDYYRDNCSTRVRDAIDRAVGGQLKAQLSTRPSNTTYRWHTRRLTRGNVFWYTALDIVLGPATDRPISQWDECFLPLKLMEHLRNVTIRDAQGRTVPLVSDERTLFNSTRPPEPLGPPNWVVQFFFAGALIGIGFVALARWSGAGRMARIICGIVLWVYCLVVGLIAWLSLWAWGFSHHWAAWRNENLMGYCPLLLPLIVLIPLLFGDRPRVRQAALGLALAVVISTVIGCILCPFLPQVNAGPMALILPINLGLLAAIWMITRKETEAKPSIDQLAGANRK